ncbi:BEL1-like homeodomain protein 11 [Pistacia vera]|uniref:BEL1-like homeodomain protein 11 n=1 Tax=Pistacia vera TaxID=55513 RepID=UPI001263BF3F|nr:BEL1-like homeodomain protein 11 [Pistacia vera]XP_031269129.1 BEL1-like homeodomain protein 11 [Pistacia vera]XP_031269130.1 BEL1-like homeodomain protein 11 [Pistacia vera]XP_031269131.1 BEL1-like homeodomain protein 11 [Pistacia vera]
MVSKDSPPNPASNMLHQFIISDSITGRNQFENQNFDAYGSAVRANNSYRQSLGLLPTIQSLGERISRSMDLVHAPAVAEESEISHTRHLMDLLGASNETNHQAQRLSLSLGSHMLVPSVQYKQRSLSSDITSNYLFCGNEGREVCNPGFEHVSDDYSFTAGTFTSSSTSANRSCSSDGTESFAIAIRNSKFLKPAQSLLEEVSVGGRNIDKSDERYIGDLYHSSIRGGQRLSSELKAEFCNNGMLSAEKYELHLGIAKLISLLEEVESKYEKYYHQMEEVVSSFEVIAGLGAAKSYTALALQAMSRHFGRLRDAIISQINVTSRRFSQDLPKISSGLSQLSLFDRESRHYRMSLQQLGMLQTQRQVWRPIRGLPETSVSILRSWLFEHFLHPYPNESEKLMLASQTGLTKNQVSNWFINARVRLWKPMIEEMYKEEFADFSEDSNPSLATSSTTREGIADHPEED